MPFCPNLSNPEIKNQFDSLVKEYGENTAYYLWDKYQGMPPKSIGGNKEFVSNWYKERFGNNRVFIKDSLENLPNAEVLGYVQEGAAYLNSNAPLSTTYHEGFHMLFRTSLNDEQRADLLEDAVAEFGEVSPEEIEAVMLVQPELNVEQARELALEEKMAEAFRTYALNEEEVGKTLGQKIRKFFKKLWNYIQMLAKRPLTMKRAFFMLESNSFIPSFVRNVNSFGNSKAYMIREFAQNRLLHEELLNVGAKLVVDRLDDALEKTVGDRKGSRRAGRLTMLRMMGDAKDQGPSEVQDYFLSMSISDFDGNVLSKDELERYKNLLLANDQDGLEEFFSMPAADENGIILDEDGEPIPRYSQFPPVFDSSGEVISNRFLTDENLPVEMEDTRLFEAAKNFKRVFENWYDKADDRGRVQKGFRAEMLEKMSEFGIKAVEKEMVVTEVEDEIGEVERVYSISRLEENPADKLSQRQRILLSRIPMETDAKSYTGLQTYVPAVTVYRSVLEAAADKKNFNEMMNAIEVKAKSSPYMARVHDFINNLDPEQQAGLFTAFNLGANEFITVEVVKGSDGVTNKIFSPNVNGLEKQFELSWRRASTLDGGPLIKRLDRNGNIIGYQINEETKEDVKRIAPSLGINSRGILTSTTWTLEQQADFARMLLALGYNIAETEEEAIRRVQAVIGKKVSDVDFPLKHYINKGTIIGTTVYNILNDRPFSTNYFEGESTTAKAIVRSFVAPFESSKAMSFLNVAHKSIYPINLKSRLNNESLRVKNGELLEDLRGTVQHDVGGRQSMLFKLLSSRGFPANHKFADVDGLKLTNAFTSEPKELEDISYLDVLAVRMIQWVNQTNREGGYISLDTQGDRKRMPVAFFPRLNKQGSKEKYNLSLKELNQIFEDEIMLDLNRMSLARKDIEAAKGDVSKLIEGYHYRSKNGTPDYSAGSWTNFNTINMKLPVDKAGLPTTYNGKSLVSLLESVEIAMEKETQLDARSMETVLSLVNTARQEIDLDVEKTIGKIHAQGYTLEKFVRQYLDQSEVGDAVEFVREFVTNDRLGRMVYRQMFRDGLTFTKNGNDFVKRAQLITTPGTQGTLKGDLPGNPEYGLSRTFNASTIRDVFTQLEESKLELIEKRIASVYGQDAAKKIVNNYRDGNIQSTDAQAFITLKHWYELQQGDGNTSKPMEQAIEDYYSAPAGQRRWSERLPITAMKPSWDGRIIKDMGPYKLAVNYSDKTSYIVLTDELVEGIPALENLLARMEARGRYSGLKPIEVVHTDSAQKLAIVPAKKLEVSGDEDLSDMVVQEMDSQYLRFPEKTPLKRFKEEMLLGRQAKVNMLANIDDNTIYKYNDGDDMPADLKAEVTGKELKDNFHRAIATKLRLNLEAVYKEMGYDEVLAAKEFGTFEEQQAALKKFRAKIVETLADLSEEKEFNIGVIDALIVDPSTGNTVLPLGYATLQGKFDQLLFSIFKNRVYQQKVKGVQTVQFADLGGAVKSKKLDKTLKFLELEGERVVHAEVDLRADFLERIGIDPRVIDEANTTGDMSNINAELRRVIGYRIPQQGKNSLLIMKIRRVLPKSHDGVARVPAGITTMMGSDFDIDKMFIMYPEIEVVDAANESKSAIKGVNKLFNENPELASIGSPEKYSAYLETIFPDSKVKDIVYHAGWKPADEKFDVSRSGDGEFGKGIYFTPSLQSAKEYAAIMGDAPYITKAIVNLKNPVVFGDEKPKKGESRKYIRSKIAENPNNDGTLYQPKEFTEEEQLDYGVDAKQGHELKVNSAEQIIVLGTKEDIEGFKKFVEKSENSSGQLVARKVRVPYGELSADPTSIANLTEAQLNNIIFDTFEAVASNAAHLHETFTPLDGRDLKVARNNSIYSQENVDIFSTADSIQTFVDNMFSHRLRGAYANAVLGRNTVLGANIPKEELIYENETYGLDELEFIENNYPVKSEGLERIALFPDVEGAKRPTDYFMQLHLGGAVDSVKDPLQAAINDTRVTAKFYVYMYSRGLATKQAVAFMNHPVVREVTNNVLTKASGVPKEIRALEGKILAKIKDKKAKDAAIKAAMNESGKFDFDLLRSEHGDLDALSPKRQLEVLIKLKRMNTMASDLTNLYKNATPFTIDKSGTTAQNLAALEEMEYYLFSENKGSIYGGKSIIGKILLGDKYLSSKAYYDAIKANVDFVTNAGFLANQKGLRVFRSALAALRGGKPLDEKKQNLVLNMARLYLATKPGSAFFESGFLDKGYIDQMFLSDKDNIHTLYKQVQEILRSAGISNAFVENLKPHVEAYNNGKKVSRINSIAFNNTLNRDISEQNSIIAGWESLYFNSLNYFEEAEAAVLKNFAMAMLTNSIVTTGSSPGPKSLGGLIPPRILEDLEVSEDFMQGIEELENSPGMLLNNFLEPFIQMFAGTNVGKTGFLNYYDASEFKGMSKLPNFKTVLMGPLEARRMPQYVTVGANFGSKSYRVTIEGTEGEQAKVVFRKLPSRGLPGKFYEFNIRGEDGKVYKKSLLYTGNPKKDAEEIESGQEAKARAAAAEYVEDPETSAELRELLAKTFEEQNEGASDEKSVSRFSRESEDVNPSEFTNYSGGADGADSTWDIVGRKFGVVNHKHFYYGEKTPKGNFEISDAEYDEGLGEVAKAAKLLKKNPKQPRTLALLSRNWAQVKNSDQVVAIAPLEDSKKAVKGGTGWAVAMAQLNGKEVYVFDLESNQWHKWNGTEFVRSAVPVLAKNFAGIGSRKITDKGIAAIRDAYKNTFDVDVESTDTAAPTKNAVQDTVSVVNRYSAQSVSADPGRIYVFGNNVQDTGKGGQAIIRDLPNAFGIVTKMKPSTSKDAYFYDTNLEANKAAIDNDIQEIKNDGRPVVFPKDGIGTGLAKLKEKAPKTYEYLKQRLLDEFGFDNDTGEVISRSDFDVTPRITEDFREEGFTERGAARFSTIDLVGIKTETPASLQQKIDRLYSSFLAAGVDVTIVLETLEPGVKGMVDNGVVFLDPDQVTEDTAYHELGHILVDMLPQDEVDRYIDQVIQADPELAMLVTENYPNLSGRELGKEILVTAIGIEGARIEKKRPNKLQRIINAILRALGKLFGITPNAAAVLAEKMFAGDVRSLNLDPQTNPKIQYSRKLEQEIDSAYQEAYTHLERRLRDLKYIKADRATDFERVKIKELQNTLVKMSENKDSIDAFFEFKEFVEKQVVVIDKHLSDIEAARNKPVSKEQALELLQKSDKVRETLETLYNSNRSKSITDQIASTLKESYSQFSAEEQEKALRVTSDLTSALLNMQSFEDRYIQNVLPLVADVYTEYADTELDAKIQSVIDTILKNRDTTINKQESANPDIIRLRNQKKKMVAEGRLEEWEDLVIAAKIEHLKNKRSGRENIIRELKSAYVDKSLFSLYLDPFIYSNQANLQLFALTLKDSELAANKKSIELRYRAEQIYNRYKAFRGTDFNKNNFYEPFLTTTTIKQDDKEVEVLSIVQPFDSKRYYKNMNAMYDAAWKRTGHPGFEDADTYSKWAESDAGKAYRKEKAKWHKENTVPVDGAQEKLDKMIEERNSKLTLKNLMEMDGDLTAAGLIEQEVKELNSLIGSSYDKVNKQFMGRLAKPNSKYYDAKYLEIQSTPELKEMYDFLIEVYKERQINAYGKSNPQFKHAWDDFSYVAPSMRRTDLESLQSQGFKGYLNELSEKVTSADTDQEMYGAAFDQDDNPVKYLPRYFTNVVEEKAITRDILSSILGFSHKAYQYEEKAKLTGLVNAMLNIYERREVIRTDENGMKLLSREATRAKEAFAERFLGSTVAKSMGDKSNTLDHLSQFIDVAFYGIYKKPMNSKILGMDPNKLATTINSLSALGTLSFNLLQVGNQAILDTLMSAEEGVAADFYTKKDLLWAEKEFVASGAGIRDMGQFNPKTKLGKAMVHFNALFDVTDNLGGSASNNKALKMMSTDRLFFLQSGIEYQTSATRMLAAMNNTKGKMKDSAGNVIMNADGTEASLWDLMLETEKGLELDPRVDKAQSNFSEAKFMAKLHGISKRTNQIKGTFDSSTAVRSPAGILLMLYKQFFIPNFRKRFGHGEEYHVDYELGSVTRGAYFSYLSFLKQIKNSLKSGAGISGVYNNLSEVDKANLRRVHMDAAIIATSMAIFSACMSVLDDDDEDENYWVAFTAYQARRLQTELLAYVPVIGYGEVLTIFKSPIAAANRLERVWDFAKHVATVEARYSLSFNPSERLTKDAVYQRDSYWGEEGTRKSWGKLKRILPLVYGASTLDKGSIEDKIAFFSK